MTPSLEVRGGEASPEVSQGEVVPTPTGGHRAGTGRLSADAYVGAERSVCHHEELAVGQCCPVCGQIFTAALPHAAGAEKYSPRARAVLVVSRYYLGLPFYRVASYQTMLGVPVPDATQWDQIERVGDCCYVVFEYMETVAAQGELIRQDDTSVRILTLLKENQRIRARAEAQGVSRPPERTGMFTTALVVKVVSGVGPTRGEQLICLYYSGRAHAGENLAALLALN